MKVALATSTTPAAIGRRSHSLPSASKLAPPLRQGRSLGHALRVAIRRCRQSGNLTEISPIVEMTSTRFFAMCDVGADRCVCPLLAVVFLGTHKGCPYGSLFPTFHFQFSTLTPLCGLKLGCARCKSQVYLSFYSERSQGSSPRSGVKVESCSRNFDDTGSNRSQVALPPLCQ